MTIRLNILPSKLSIPGGLNGVLVLALSGFPGIAAAFETIQSTVSDSNTSRFVTLKLEHEIGPARFMATAFHAWKSNALNYTHIGAALRMDFGNGLSVTPSIQRLENQEDDISDSDEADTSWISVLRLEYKF